MSEERLKKPRTPLTGSSEDHCFHFHASTSPSDRSSDISEESGEFCAHKMSDRHRSSTCFFTNEEFSQCLERGKNKNVSQDTEIIDNSVECLGGITWVTEISTENLKEPRTALSRSSEDLCFHFHPSTSPSESSSDISEKTGECCDYKMSVRHRSTACFFTNEESSECLKTDKTEVLLDAMTQNVKYINDYFYYIPFPSPIILNDIFFQFLLFFCYSSSSLLLPRPSLGGQKNVSEDLRTALLNICNM